MEIINFDKKIINSQHPKVIALGKFTSFHLGHQKLLEKTLLVAKQKKIKSMSMLFKDFNFFTTQFDHNILNENERIDFLKNNKFDYCLLFEKRLENYQIDHNDFISILKDKLKITDVVVGKNFKFGYKRLGNIENLKDNFNVHIVDDIKFKNNNVSTSVLDLLFLDKDFDNFNKLLGYKWFFQGEVIHGDGIGKKIGFPTANIKYLKGKKVIEDGIYISTAILKNKKYNSLTSISNSPTFNGNKIKYETFLINYHGDDFYGENLIVEIHKFLREPKKFSSIDKMIEKIHEDIKLGNNYFNKQKNR